MRRTLWLAAALALACTSSLAPPEPAAGSPPPAAPIAPAPAAAPDPVAPPRPAEAPPADPPPVDPAGFGDACDDDAGCTWDDACVPQRCVGAGPAPRGEVACDESAPPPGACHCVDRRCALRPAAPPPDEPGCRIRGCGLDESAGRCVVGSMREANRLPRDRGPICSCDRAQDRCVFAWLEPIPCAGVDACWISETTPWHPIARPRRLRGRRFRPCRDGELAPACRDGRCTLDAYMC